MGSGDPEQTLPAATSRASDVRIFALGELAAGRYKILRFVAAGAMGEVYAATDAVVGSEVALKVLRAELAGSGEAIERLRREIALARKVTNVHVCRLHDVGEHAGHVFLTMELLDGITLADHVKQRGALPLAEVEQLAAQLVAGLAALHAAGIVHRDFKTANTMLTDTRAVITDFGLARAADGGDAALTADARLVGTPAYMAPEQVEGRPATPASDIYALGVVLFELLTGVVPFREDTPLATATARLHKQAPRVSSVRDDVPARWDAIVARCLARDPAERVEDVLAGTARRRRVWLMPAVAAVGAAVATVVLVAGNDSRSAAPACPSAAAKLTGVWDARTRSELARRFTASTKPFVADMWRAHATQFERFFAGWSKRWDAACASSDRTSDPLLYGQRLACLDARLVDARSYIGGMSDTSIDVEDFARASPGEYPIIDASECDITALLRAQRPPPPPANRAEVDRLMAQGNALRAKLRLPSLGGVEVDTSRYFDELAIVEDKLIALGHPEGAGELRYWREIFLRVAGRADEAHAVTDSLVELAEQTGDDALLVRALVKRQQVAANRSANYDVGAADAVFVRANKLVQRLGNPPSLRFDVAEAHRDHSRRLGRHADLRRALETQVETGVLTGIPYMASWVRCDLVDLAGDASGAHEIMTANEALLGPANLNLAQDYMKLMPVLARAGDRVGALDGARRAIAIARAAEGTRPDYRVFKLEAQAAGYAMELARVDEATAHVRAAVRAAAARGTSELEAHALLAVELLKHGQLAAARHVLTLARDVQGSAVERARVDAAEVFVRFEAGDSIAHDVWAPKVASLDAGERAEAVALIEARNGRLQQALAHVAAITDENQQLVAHAEVLVERGRFADAIALLGPKLERLGNNSGPQREVHALLGIARVETRAFADALVPLERAVDANTVTGERARFALARALVATNGDRARARSLAARARTAFARMQLARDLRAVDAWLAAQPN